MELVRPLLAAKTTDEDLKRIFKNGRPMLLSPKIDGIRALVASNGSLVSRTLKPIRNYYTQNLFGRPNLIGLDGELVVGAPSDKGLMQQTQSGVMSEFGRPNVSYWIFDMWDMRAPFQSRFEAAAYLSTYDENVNIYVVPHRMVHSYDELMEWEHQYLSEGYEGVMLRSLAGGYKQGRSTLREGILLKVKRFHDGEARILGYAPLYRNENEQVRDERGYAKRSSAADGKFADDLLGSLHVRDLESEVVFDIGSGFTESQRRALWEERHKLLGRIIKYKSYKLTGVKDKPRFPIFLGFRHPEDM